MYIWGHNLLNKLPGVSRKRRKREASKIRRADLKERDRDAALPGSVEIYLPLLDEGVDVWRPVAAEPLDSDTYRIVTPRPPGEKWPFRTGDVVRCEWRVFDEGAGWVAVERIDPAA